MGGFSHSTYICGFVCFCALLKFSNVLNSLWCLKSPGIWRIESLYYLWFYIIIDIIPCMIFVFTIYLICIHYFSFPMLAFHTSLFFFFSFYLSSRLYLILYMNKIRVKYIYEYVSSLTENFRELNKINLALFLSFHLLVWTLKILLGNHKINILFSLEMSLYWGFC